ncbi:MAG TPA: hypothetical protein VN706_12900 [Gemmatimonadaceae bacterium]|nr:hypothetical protein [Gemmatimonadaceae bacterium]
MGFFSRVREALRQASGAPGDEWHQVRGFSVLVQNTRPDIETHAVLLRLDEALGLIDTYQPWRLAHLRRDVRHILVARFPCRGAYFPEHRVVMTELTFLARTDITAAPVASSILHEGVHARVHAMGVSPIDRDTAHEERLCRRAELAFGMALPPALGAPVVERAQWSLELDDTGVAPEVDWVEAKRRQDAVDAAARSRDGHV